MILTELWRKRRWTAVVLVVSVLIALFAMQSGRNVQFGAASTEILVDAHRSPLIDSRGSFNQLANAATVYSQLLTSGSISAAIAKAAGLPRGSVVAEAPVLDDNLPRSLSEPMGNEVSTNLLSEGGKNRVSFKATPNLPIVAVYAQAPNPKNAVALANAAVVGLTNFLNSAEDAQGVPSAQRITVTQLGAATGGWVNSGARKELAAIVLSLVFVIGCVLIIFVGHVSRALRGRAPVELDKSGLAGEPMEAAASVIPAPAHATVNARSGADAPPALATAPQAAVETVGSEAPGGSEEHSAEDVVFDFPPVTASGSNANGAAAETQNGDVEFELSEPAEKLLAPGREGVAKWRQLRTSAPNALGVGFDAELPSADAPLGSASVPTTRRRWIASAGDKSGVDVTWPAGRERPLGFPRVGASSFGPADNGSGADVTQPTAAPNGSAPAASNGSAARPQSRSEAVSGFLRSVAERRAHRNGRNGHKPSQSS